MANQKPKRLGKKAKKRANKAAKRLDKTMHHVAFTLANNKKKPNYGKLGPASECKSIDLSTVDLSKYE